MTGKTIGHYRIEGKIGQGGMGVVYKAQDLRLGRTVALKFLPPNTLDESQRKRFLEEARNAALIQHPNICPIHDVGDADGQLFFAMAYIEGVTLSSLISGQPMEIAAAVDIASQIAAGLEEAHKHGIIHRDIKSTNIVVTSQGHPYILDFGLALKAGSDRLTVDGGIAGTPSYMSPEQAQGQEVDHRTDIWSLGAVLFEMLTGRVPFRRDTDWAGVHAIIYDPLPPLHALRPEISQNVEQAVAKALQKLPEDRWQSAADFSAELRRVSQLAPKPSETPTQIAPSLLKQERPVKRKGVVAVAAAGLMIAALGGAGLLWQQRTKSDLPQEMHIAVLPFNVIGDDPNVRALADGLVETLTSKLSQLDQFQGKVLVIPASEIRSRKITSAEDARKIYGANLVITGSAIVTLGTIQFTLNLIDPEKMRQLGARTFDFDPKNPVLVRDGAMEGLLGLLSLQLNRESRRDVAEGETASASAYADYLKGTGYLARYTVTGNIDLALGSLQSAVKADPGYANAFAGLAQVYLRKTRFSGEKYWGERAIESAKKAVELAPNLAAAHISLGDVLLGLGKEEESIKELQRALQLSPGNAEAYRSLADVLFNRGRFKEAEELYREAVVRRPGDWLTNLQLGLFLRATGRYKEAETSFQQALKLTPDNVVVLRNLAGLYRLEARYPEARELLQKALSISRNSRVQSVLGVVYFYEHRFSEGCDAAEAAVDMDSSDYGYWGNKGMICRWAPDGKDKATLAFRRAIELARKQLAVTPKNYQVRRDLAEYHANLGEGKQAMEELAKLPREKWSNFTVSFVLIYELIGKRKEAIEFAGKLTDPLSFNDIKNDPNLSQLWADPELQATILKTAR